MVIFFSNCVGLFSNIIQVMPSTILCNVEVFGNWIGVDMMVDTDDFNNIVGDWPSKTWFFQNIKKLSGSQQLFKFPEAFKALSNRNCKIRLKIFGGNPMTFGYYIHT